MSELEKRSDRWWWFGVIAGSFFIAVLPYWLLNLFADGSLASPWWRIPVATRGVFDSYVYFNWMGAAANGLPAGDLIRWYALIVKEAWSFMSSWASVPEIWIATRWLSVALSVFIGSWAVRSWSGLDRKTSRIIACAFALAVACSIGLRPGAYSWYLPFALAAFASVSKARSSLRDAAIVPAIGWSIAGIALSSVYPWYFMFVGLWTASVWGAFLAERHRVVLLGALSLVVIFICTAAPWAADWFLRPERAAFLGPYERSGIVFARVPFFANTIIAFGAWVVLFAALAYAFKHRDDLRDRAMRDAWAWIALALLWFNTPVTGIHLYSDHFIGPTLILSWLSFSSVIATTREARTSPGGMRDFPMSARWLFVFIATGATLFVAYVIQQPLRIAPQKFDSYAVHVLHWFALAVAGWLCVNRVNARKLPADRRVMTVLVVGAVIVGAWGTGAVVARDAKTVAELQRRIPAVDWLKANMPSDAPLCADVESASFYAAHTGLAVLPAEATLSYSVSNETILRMLETIAGAYDVAASGDLPMFRFETDHYRTIPCAAASKYSHNAMWDRVLRKLGLDEADVQDWIGCRQSVIDANWARVFSAIEQRRIDEPSFRTMCSYVVIPDERRAFWQLPLDYREIWYGNGVGIWNGPLE